MNNSFILVYITNPSIEEAKRIAAHLLSKHLIACANIVPINSMYYWQDKLCDEKEFVLLGKTLPSRYKEIKKEVESIHPYKTPCIMKISVSSNRKYFEWVQQETS